LPQDNCRILALLQDVVLPTPSVFEENMLSTLSSFVFFNKVEIVSLILEDER
jgi:protein phosphatase-4 regulatory subunit 3